MYKTNNTMSILSSLEDISARQDNSIFRSAVLANNPYLENQDIDKYAKLLSVYEKVSVSYAEFFIKYWRKDDVSKTNELMIGELERVSIITGWEGLLEAENNPLGEYVLSLDFPAKYSDIKAFFKRVMSGDLEFRSRYPIGDSDAFALIKSIDLIFDFQDQRD